MMGRFRTILCGLASLWLTLVCVVGAAGIAMAGQLTDCVVGPSMAIPFAAMFINLLAAVATTSKLRRHIGLLGFHLALAVLALLVAADRLVAMSGHVEVTEGAYFDPNLVKAKVGPLHRWRLDDIRFIQGDFIINYAPGMKRRETRSTVHMPSTDESWKSVVVGDDVPLTVDGYRFYTSFNKGFAPVITYTNSSGESYSGAIHLPSYPLQYYKQGNEWTPPGTAEKVKFWLQIPQPVYAEDDPWIFSKPENATLVVLENGERRELRPGDRLRYGSGILRYDELRVWMGYTISYNPLTPWMAGSVIVAVLSLVLHVAWKFTRYSWLDAGGRGASNGG